ncbi:cysteine hydrolase [Pseudorhodoplanes sp.]|uniref:cysteine hydrolase n=1 Tax=Pseudorhodoplanes sp. TaxID=1934341 RepID=UPI002B896CB3|nr:cysteine hydrolase [Pseudorhodoplanes sp.]HWV55806.1 cysteine hydrolase [Pseudorhodoplanes sp.]
MTYGLQLDPEKTAVVIQGTQRDLLDPDGVLSTPGIRNHVESQGMIAHIRQIAETFRARGAGVVHVLFVIEKDGRGTKANAPLYRGVLAAGGIRRGTWGVEPIDALAPREGDFVIEKARENPFYNTTFESVLTGLGVDTLVVVGALTSGGIEHTARHAADAGYRVLVPEDAVAGQSATSHRNTIEGFLPAVAEITTTRDIIDAMQHVAH